MASKENTVLSNTLYNILQSDLAKYRYHLTDGSQDKMADNGNVLLSI